MTLYWWRMKINTAVVENLRVLENANHATEGEALAESSWPLVRALEVNTEVGMELETRWKCE